MRILFVLVRLYPSASIVDSNLFLALDPNIKLAYAEDKWEAKYFAAGRERLEEVVCLMIVISTTAILIGMHSLTSTSSPCLYPPMPTQSLQVRTII